MNNAKSPAEMTDLKIKRALGALVILTVADFKLWRICLVTFSVGMVDRQKRALQNRKHAFGNTHFQNTAAALRDSNKRTRVPKNHSGMRRNPKTACVLAQLLGWVLKTQFIGRHLVGVWIGGVWNGHLNFPESEKYFSEAEISRKMPEIPQKERFSPNFRLRSLKIQSPKKCNSIPPAIPYPH